MPWNTPVTNYLPSQKVTKDIFNQYGENFNYLKERSDKVDLWLDQNVKKAGSPTFADISATGNISATRNITASGNIIANGNIIDKNGREVLSLKVERQQRDQSTGSSREQIFSFSGTVVGIAHLKITNPATNISSVDPLITVSGNTVTILYSAQIGTNYRTDLTVFIG